MTSGLHVAAALKCAGYYLANNLAIILRTLRHTVLVQLEKRLGSESVALEGIEQPNSRNDDLSEARHQASAGAPPQDQDVLPNKLQKHAEAAVQQQQQQQQQQSSQSRHDASEL